MTEAELASIQAQDVRGAALFVKDASHSRPGGKTALVGGRQTAYGMSRMYQSFAELAGQESDVRIFRSHDEALAWIESDG
jgi:hypothetical protein